VYFLLIVFLKKYEFGLSRCRRAMYLAEVESPFPCTQLLFLGSSLLIYRNYNVKCEIYVSSIRCAAENRSLSTGEKQCTKLLFGYNGRRDCLAALMHCKKSTGNNVEFYTQEITIAQKSKNIKMNARAG